MSHFTKKAIVFAILAVLLGVKSEVKGQACESCKQFQSELAQEQKTLASYRQLKIKNEEYLKKPGVPAGAIIKVNSNLLVISMKIETAANKIEAINAEKAKSNCAQCKLDG